MAMLSGLARAGGAPAAGFVFQSVEVDGRTYPYVVYRPRGLDASTPVRGLVFLHGRGECGTDGSRMLGVGLPNALVWDPHRWPFVVIIPQKPTPDSEWEDHEQAVMAMLDRAIAEHGVDPRRVAVTGLSQGGHGTIALASRHPGRFRAAAPVCGYIAPWARPEGAWGSKMSAEGTARLVESLRGTPIWLFHGGKDDVVPPSESIWLHERLRPEDARLTIFPDDDHNSWDSAYRRSELAEWLVQQTD